MWLVEFIGLIYVITSVTCNASNLPNTTIFSEDSPLKEYLVEDIVRKICNMSLNTFANKNPVEKAILLVKIEEKLNKSAQPLGIHGEKYVSLVMRGIKAFENIHVANYEQLVDTKKVAGRRDDIEAKHIFRTGKSSKSKSDLMHNIDRKIEILARGFLKNAKTPEERQNIIEKIKRSLEQTGDRKKAILHISNNDIKKYVDMVSKGVKLVMDRDLLERRRMEFVYTNNINLHKNSQDRVSDQLDPVTPHSLRNKVLNWGANYSEIRPKSVFLRIDEKTSLKPCDSSIEETCRKIQLLKTLRCLSDNKEFSILNLCNGVGDCLDFSDEKNCVQQAIQTVQSVNRLIAYIETSINAHHCFPDVLDKSMLSKQNKLLSDVLKYQLTFLENHVLKESVAVSRRVYNAKNDANSKTIHEAINVVHSLASALDISICSNTYKNKEDTIDKEDLEKEILETSHKSDQEICKCNGKDCLQTCSSRCERVCLEMYSLSQLACDAVSGQDMVSLDMICDGKLDCFDELDERDCPADMSLAKFEATRMYDYVLKEVESKTASATLDLNVRSQLQSLHKLVAKLQKLSLMRKVDVLEVKRIRQTCFGELSKVYETALTYMKNNEKELFNIRYFLVTLNERLISALKRSNTGNNKIISSDGCMCRGNKCALPKCSKSCIRACLVEPQLTRFFCGEFSEQLNNSLPIELVCNGKANCPNKEDEKDCRKDVCRPHHLIVLRHKLENVGKHEAGTALGEALRSWRLKVTATLMIAENNERPAPVVLYDILHDILHDLVTTYSILEDRRDNAPVFKEFYSLSRTVINTLKSCNQ